MTIKMQINNSGAWKTVMETDDGDADWARDCIATWAQADIHGWKKTQWRQVDASGQMVAYWRAGEGWEVKRHG